MSAQKLLEIVDFCRKMLKKNFFHQPFSQIREKCVFVKGLPRKLLVVFTGASVYNTVFCIVFSKWRAIQKYITLWVYYLPLGHNWKKTKNECSEKCRKGRFFQILTVKTKRVVGVNVSSGIAGILGELIKEGKKRKKGGHFEIIEV